MTDGSDAGTTTRDWRLVRADRDAVPASIRSATARPVSPRRRRTQLLAVLAVIAVLGAGSWVLYATSLFAVTEVRVAGTAVLDPSQVRDAAEVADGTPLARLDTGSIEARVAHLAPVASVSVVRDWPDAVVIRVTERTPVAVVKSSGGFIVLDGTGVPFDRVPQRPLELPLMELADPGPKDVTTRDALRVLKSLTPELRRVLVTLAAPSPTRIALRLTKGRSVVWGDAEQSEKKARVATVLLQRPVRIIDVSAPDVVTTR
ncbi:MAG: cell division protein FtsQ/DivIB [Micromonosporaceae bacterium]